MTQDNGGRIFNTSKGKGYESLSRNMLQDTNLSLEAIGLLANIQSYPTNWKLYKTELYNRFPKNKRKSIERIWEELVSNGYIVQFRKRVGRKFVYQYLVSSEKYTKEEILDLIKEAESSGYHFYHKDMLKLDDKSTINPIDFINLKGDKIKASDDDINFFDDKEAGGKLPADDDSKNFEAQEPYDINDSWDVPFGQSNVNSSKGTPNKLTNKRSTTNKFTSNSSLKEIDDDEINNKRARAAIENMVQIIKTNEEFKVLAQLLFESNVDMDEIAPILEYFDQNPSKFKIDVIEQQLSWMQHKSSTDVGVSDFAKYFINGIEMRTKGSDVSIEISIEDEFYDRLGIDRSLPKVPLHNWLGEE